LTRTRSEHDHGSREAAPDGHLCQAHPRPERGLYGQPRQRGPGLRRSRHGPGREKLHPELLHPRRARRCYTIGQFPDWSTTAARAKARELRREIDAGGDPLAEIEAERSAPTVAEVIDRFEAEHLPRKRPQTARDYRRMLDNHIRPHFGAHAKVADVVYADVDALHRKITKSGAKYAANRCVAILSKMFSLSVRWGMREDNPCKGVERNTEHHRQRYLIEDELSRLVAALAGHPDRQAADAVRLLLLTGARRGEVLGARWADIDLTAGSWSKPASSTKQNRPHHVPLCTPARARLARIREDQSASHPNRPLAAFVFPSTAS
jgi:site-specific recombinase XerD